MLAENFKTVIESTLAKFPEVKWDRWIGELAGPTLGVVVYGWIAREDGKSDFLLLRIDYEGAWFFSTSSAKYSKEFGERIGFTATHMECKRVADHFQIENRQS